MLTFAIAAAGTAALGLIALHVPAVHPHLAAFSKWAGIFMQVAGLIEALRRLVSVGDQAWSIMPQSPQVVLAGTAPAGAQQFKPKVASAPAGSTAKSVLASLGGQQQAPMSQKPMAQFDIDGITKVLDGYTPDTFIKFPKQPDKIRARLIEYIPFTPSGDADFDAAAGDPIATAAIELYQRVDRLEDEAKTYQKIDALMED